MSFWPWDAIMSIPQHISQQLSKDYNIIYACSNQYHFSKNKREHLKKSWELQFYKVAENLNVVEFPFFPAWKFSFIRTLNHKQWATSISKYLIDNNIKIDILWLSSPEQLPFLKIIKRKLSCYHCFDPYEEFYPKLSLIEPEMFQKTDITFVTAPKLEAKAKIYSKNVFLVPNGAEIEHFQKVIYQKFNLPYDIKKTTRPRIGYIGTIAHWMNFDIIEDLSQNVNASIILIGPVESEIAIKLQDEGKVLLLGKKPYKDLPSYLAFFDVCIIPFKDNELVRAVDPIKVYEYLSAGKEVVTTPMPALDRIDNLIHQVKPQDFSDTVKRVLQSKKSSQSIKNKADLMHKHSWGSRAKSITEVFKKNGF